MIICDECKKDVDSTSGAHSKKYMKKMLCNECLKDDTIERGVENGVNDINKQIDTYHNPTFKTEFNFTIAEESDFETVKEILRRLWKQTEYNRVDVRVTTDLKTVEKP